MDQSVQAGNVLSEVPEIISGRLVAEPEAVLEGGGLPRTTGIEATVDDLLDVRLVRGKGLVGRRDW